MKPENIQTEATIGLSTMRRELTKYEDELPTITVMHMICEAMRQVSVNADKGEYGAFAVKSLIALWKQLKLGEVTGEKLSDLNAVVEQMYEKATAEYRRPNS